MLYKCRPLSWADGWRDRVSSGNHTVTLIPASSCFGASLTQKGQFLFFFVSSANNGRMFNCIQERSSSYGNGLQLAGNIPDQSSGVKGNIGVVAYLVKY